MAFLADPDAPCPSSPFDRIEWVVVVPLAVILTAFVLLSTMPLPQLAEPSATGVCERATFPVPNRFLLALH